MPPNIRDLTVAKPYTESRLDYEPQNESKPNLVDHLPSYVQRRYVSGQIPQATIILVIKRWMLDIDATCSLIRKIMPLICHINNVSYSLIRVPVVLLNYTTHLGHPKREKLLFWRHKPLFHYRKLSNMRRPKSQNLDISRLDLQLSFCNILKSCVK